MTSAGMHKPAGLSPAYFPQSMQVHAGMFSRGDGSAIQAPTDVFGNHLLENEKGRMIG